MSLREAAQQALEALEGIHPGNMTPMAEEYWNKAITALRTALAEPEQEPVAIPKGWIPLRIEWEPGYPEDVAFGPPYLMNRLKKWLDKHFANLTAPQRTEPEQDDTALLRQALSTLEGWANYGKWVWPESALEQAKRNTEEAITPLRERLEGKA